MQTIVGPTACSKTKLLTFFIINRNLILTDCYSLVCIFDSFKRTYKLKQKTTGLKKLIGSNAQKKTYTIAKLMIYAFL